MFSSIIFRSCFRTKAFTSHLTPNLRNTAEKLHKCKKSFELVACPSYSCANKDGGLATACLNTPQKRRHLIGNTFSSAESYILDENLIGVPLNTAKERVGVLLLNLGGPETLQDVQPFLFNLFADPVYDFAHFTSYF